jgi:hypothetical protein
MTQQMDVVLFVALVAVASLAVWWLGYVRTRRDNHVLDEIRAHDHKKAA